MSSLTLASPAMSGPLWARNTRSMLTTLSDSAQRVIAASEAVGDYDSPDYQTAMNEFYGKYVWRRPLEANLDSTMKSFGQPTYLHMWGPSEFTITGTLKRYDVTRQLRSIRVPSLYTVGEFDEADTATVRRFAALTPGSQYAIIPDAAHITTWDNAAEMLRVVREFLRSVDAPPTQSPVPAAISP